MDYIEVMDFCGYDMDKASEMSRQTDTKSLSEVIEDIMCEVGLERKEGKDDVHRLQP